MGLDAQEQTFVDRTLIDLDGTDDKSRLGANAMLAASMAVARAAAEESGLSLYRYFGGSGPMSMPVPMMNVINGGAHANNTLDMQELMILRLQEASERKVGAIVRMFEARAEQQAATRAAEREATAAANAAVLRETMDAHQARLRPGMSPRADRRERTFVGDIYVCI